MGNLVVNVVDAFTDKPFTGNPAAVVVVHSPIAESRMKCIAREMNLSETAFIEPTTAGFNLRWFTPTTEVKLCGHATLASAFVLWKTGVLRSSEVARFHTLSGELVCRAEGDWIEMDFPSQPPVECKAPPGLSDALGQSIRWTGFNGSDYLCELSDENAVRSLSPDFTQLARIKTRGVIATSRSDSPDFDFVSRFFAPAAGINEDPVTGSAHCALGPYWQTRIGNANFTARQVSQRGGVVKVRINGDRVMLLGQAVLVSRNELLV